LHSSQANFNGKNPYGGVSEGEYLERPREVGSYRPNAFGLYDMHGNVGEWCTDSYAPYDLNLKKDPIGLKNGEDSIHVFRGGSWGLSGDYCRSADRGNRLLRLPPSLLGFRIVCVMGAP
jgi:formylglycine-generating enzyme required for sulfatase activity